MLSFEGEHRNHTFHFQVGRQVHTDRYYYDKYYFQSAGHSDQVSEKLSALLQKQPFDLDELTLIGVGGFCGSFLQKTVDALKLAHPGRKVNYGLINNELERLSFVFEPVFYRHVLIVLPVTYTFARAFDLERVIRSEAAQLRRHHWDEQDLQVLPHYLSVFLVADMQLNVPRLAPGRDHILEGMLQGEYEPALAHVVRLYEGFGWYAIHESRVLFIDRQPYKDRTGHFLEAREATLFAGERCRKCFPREPGDELPLLPIRGKYDAPNLIFHLPRFANQLGVISPATFSEVFQEHHDTGHIFGHIEIGENSFHHYIRRDRFYENNRSAILAFFARELKRLFPGLAESEERLLIISPNNMKGSPILDEMLSAAILPPARTVISYIDPSREFPENFLASSEPELNNFQYVVYIDYVISKGKTFKLLSDYLRYARGEFRGFDAALVITDRTTAYSKADILHKLYSGRDGEWRQMTNRLAEPSPDAEKVVETGRFVGFFKLNMPLLDAHSDGNPILERNRRLEDMYKYCQLDGLKKDILRQLRNNKPTELEKQQRIHEQRDAESKAGYLMKLAAAHEISNYLYEYVRITHKGTPLRQVPFGLPQLTELIREVCDRLQGGEQTERSAQLARNVIEVLAQPPFKFYEGIFSAVFEYVKTELIRLCGQLKDNRYILQQRDAVEFAFYVTRSVELNSNFLLSALFLETLKFCFEERANWNQPFTPTLNSISFNYKMLVFANPARSIRLEELLNMDEHLPRPYQPDQEGGIMATLGDRFYMLGRLLKAENNYILHQLKADFSQQIRDDAVDEDSGSLQLVERFIADRYLSRRYDRTSKVIRNFQEFILRSKDAKVPQSADSFSALPPAICEATTAMLKTVYRLDKQETGPDSIPAARTILTEAARIAGPDLEFAFCIEYRGRRHGNTDTTNIYTILPKAAQQQKIDSRGLIWQMLYGLGEGLDQQLQTFLVIVRNADGTYGGFQEHYYSMDREGGTQGRAVDIDALRYDLRLGLDGVLPEDSQLILLLRLAVVSQEGDSGQAVLVLSSRAEPTTENFLRFLNMERIRMLLVIKEDLMAYLQAQFENDAFIGLVARQERLDYKDAMQHMLDGYFLALNSLWDPQTKIFRGDMRIYNFILNKIRRHVLSMGEDKLRIGELLGNLGRKPVLYTATDVQELFELAMITPRLARMPLPEGTRRLRLNIGGGFSCPAVIFEQVITEILVNMRRYALNSDEAPFLFKIELSDDILYFENPYDPVSNPNPEAKSKDNTHAHGKTMCDQILVAYDYRPLQGWVQPPPGHLYRVALDLKQTFYEKNTDH